MPTLKPGENILKSRDDREYVTFSQTADGMFVFPQGVKTPWHKIDEPFGPDKLRDRIEPWLTSLFQSEHLSLLIGSGLTLAVGGLAGCKEFPTINTFAKNRRMK